VQFATFSPIWRHLDPVTGTIAIAQPLLIFFNKDPTKKVYLVIIYKKAWYFSESKTIVVQRCLSHLFRHVILGSMREKCKIL
jgi:hypothetical protein